MEPLSRPVVPPQPDKAQYGVSELALFKSYSRESFRSAFGVQAPVYDAKRRLKTWFDSSVDQTDPEGLVVYRVLAQDKTGAWVLRQVGMTAREAGTLNVPGAVEYPAYVAPPTRATRGGALVNPDYLSLETDARVLMVALGGEGLVDEGITTVFSVEYPSDEPRRMWSVMFRARAYNVGILLKSRNAAGAGSPGHWSTQTGEPVWVSETPAAGGSSELPAWDVPLRELLPNEKLQGGLFGAMVVRTDKQAEAELASGKFLPADRQLLQQIWQALQSRVS